MIILLLLLDHRFQWSAGPKIHMQTNISS